jgi:hypothetical protein
MKASPTGVLVRTFRGVRHEGVAEPKGVAVAIKMWNEIVYHLPSGEYMLSTRAHRASLFKYDPFSG